MGSIDIARVALVLLLLGAALSSAGESAAHPGGLDREGCHHDRRNGGYHCHRAPAAATPVPQHGLAPREDRSDAQPRGRAYRNCDEARAAGAAPVRRGEPGYGPHLDRDNDGIGCEPYRGR
ncbi:excalibur calcium-binding domain-containing protein [Pseudoxanthomonas sp. 10H]|uniref:excalibur calcium-binding domain-containing protein n=1 Tax=Pseudoxanthomonas sp. 10H TaxID=3242729 RepID=UPI00355732BC